jgi:hypothetical protein
LNLSGGSDATPDFDTLTDPTETGFPLITNDVFSVVPFLTEGRSIWTGLLIVTTLLAVDALNEYCNAPRAFETDTPSCSSFLNEFVNLIVVEITLTVGAGLEAFSIGGGVGIGF